MVKLFARAVLIFGLLAGCSAPQTTPKSAAPDRATTFPTDDLGRVIALKAPATRVITLAPGATETMFALGARTQLVGRDQASDFPVAAKSLPVAGDYQGPNIEQTIALRPDLVIVQGETYDRARAEDWQRKIGAPVAILGARNLGLVRQDIEKIGAWIGKLDAAKTLAQTLIVPAATTLNLPPKPKVFIEIDPTSLYTAGRGTLVSDVVEASGFRNAVDIKGYAPYNVESLLANAPDVYLVPSQKPRAQVVRRLQSSPTLSKLKCVQAGRVIVINGDLILRPGPRLKEGIAQLQARASELNKELKIAQPKTAK